MIRSFRHKRLQTLYETGASAKVVADLRKWTLRRLDALERAAAPGDLNMPGFDFHPRKGKPRRYSVHVNGPWCITFEWRVGGAWAGDVEQYQ
ncbi:MAG: type II toxin-antitoxin system RelE/ParE family toxin [Candidatus Binataceae bacterium]